MVASNPFVEKVEKNPKEEAKKKSSGKKPLVSEVEPGFDKKLKEMGEVIEFVNPEVKTEELPPTLIEQPPTEGEGAPTEGEEAPPEEEEFSLDDSKNICQAMWNIPSVIFGEHLILDESQTNSFAKQFHIYCVKKGINPFEFLFDEFGLVIAAIPIVQHMRKQHTEFKATQKGAKGKTKQSKQAMEEEERREKEREAVKDLIKKREGEE